jgi:hypothetical protein
VRAESESGERRARVESESGERRARVESESEEEVHIAMFLALALLPALFKIFLHENEFLTSASVVCEEIVRKIGLKLDYLTSRIVHSSLIGSNTDGNITC